MNGTLVITQSASPSALEVHCRRKNQSVPFSVSYRIDDPSKKLMDGLHGKVDRKILPRYSSKDEEGLDLSQELWRIITSSSGTSGTGLTHLRR